MKRGHLKGLLLLFYISFCAKLFSQDQAFFTNISTESGLSSQKVTQIIQDKFGFLWFASQNGLNKYDGYSMSVYKNDPSDSNSISNNNLSAISEQGGYIWIGTFGGGLNRFDRISTFKKFHNIPGDTTSLADNSIHYLMFDKDSSLWIATESGLSKFLPETESFKNYFVNEPIYHIAADQDSKLFLSTLNGFYVLNKNNGVFRKIEFPTSNNVLYPIKVLIDSQKKYWIGTDSGLKTFDPKSNKVEELTNNVLLNSKVSSIPILTLFEDSQNKIWIGTFRFGLFLYDKNNNDIRRFVNNKYDENTISHNSVDNVYEDKSHNIWLATPDGGLNKINLKKERFNHYYHIPFSQNQLSSDKVLSFYEDLNKNLWVGTDYNITIYDRERKKTKTIEIPGSDQFDGLISVLAINKGIKDQIWIGTRMLGLQIYNLRSNKFVDIKNNPLYPKELYNAWIRKIMHDSHGKIWITSDKGLFCYDKEKNKFEHFTKLNSTISDDVTISIYEDKAGIIWIGTRSGGLNKFDRINKSFKNYSYINNDTTSLTSNYVVSLNGDDKYIWAGTLNGLSRINRRTGKIKQITEKNGLADDCINGILIDNENTLWMSTNYGITHYKASENLFRNYDKYDRLQDNKFKGLSCYKANSGVMYFGGTNGFNSFVPEEIEDNTNIPPVVLTSLKVLYKEKKFKKELSLVKELELEHYENDLQFEFAALDYTSSQKNLYQYKLEGFNSDWSPPSTTRSTNYTNLDPGEYTFRAIGSNNDNYWNNKGIAIKIIIKTPYWNTWWFRVLLFVFVAIIITTFFKARVRGIKRQRKQLETFNKKLSDEINERKQTEVQLLSARDKAEKADKLKSEFLAQISHEIRSPINIISNYVTLIKDELREKMNDVIDISFNAIDKANNRIIRSIDLIINMSELQLGIYEPSYDKLNLKVDILDDIILQYKHSAKKKNLKLSFDSNIVEPIIYGDRYSVTQIFANLTDNAIKYTDSGKIDILLHDSKNGNIQVSITDTGLGISEEYLPTLFDSFSQEERGYTRKFEGNGLGLALVKNYCELNNAVISVESEKGVGTTMSVEFSNNKN